MDLDNLMRRAGEAVSVGRAFGEPIDHEGMVIIPVAWVAGGGGGGSDDATPEKSQNGGGFGGITWPLGVYLVKDGKVSWVPAVDATRIALAAIGLLGAVMKIAAVGRTRASRRSTERLGRARRSSPGV